MEKINRNFRELNKLFHSKHLLLHLLISKDLPYKNSFDEANVDYEVFPNKQKQVS